jgi:DNA-binding winged helix-turn-helix (wHTH) protein/TolB-like protein
MVGGTSAHNIVRFDVFEVDLHCGELRKSGVVVRLQDQPFLVLRTLLEQPGELVSREQLRNAVWPQDTFVDFDHALSTAVKKIRCALADDAFAPRFIQTIPRRGYRFIAPVHRVAPSDPAAATRQPKLAKWWPLPAMILLLTFALFTGAGINAKDHHATTKRVAVVVLPVENLSSDPNLDKLGQGLMDEAISRLGALNPDRLAVTARTTAMKYQNSRKTAAEIGREARVDYIVEMCLRSEGGIRRITMRIVRTRDENYVWSGNFDQTSRDDLATESDIATAVTAQVQALLLTTK